MTDEARLEDVGTGLAPVTPGWFVVNAGDAAWVRNAGLASRCVFESNRACCSQRPDLEEQRFDEVGITLSALEPGKPSGLYHAESAQEDFLVLAGECLLVIEDQERRLRAWDPCLPGGDQPRLRRRGRRPVRDPDDRRAPPGPDDRVPRSERALQHGAGVETATDSPAKAYAPLPPWGLARPDAWAELPWAR